MSNAKDKLWNGLPAVFYRNKYVVYSPYANRILRLSKQELSDEIIISELSKNGFFGSPSELKDERLSVTLYLTGSCNLKCIYCFDEAGDNCTSASRKFMTPQFAIDCLKKIIFDFGKIIRIKGARPKLNIHFFGGEPTLNFRTIKAVVEFLEKEKIDSKYNISTNLIAPRHILSWLVKKNFRFDISCDGPPEITNKQRPMRSSKLKTSDYVENAIRYLVSKNARLRTKVVITEKTIAKMPEIVSYLAGLGIDHVRLEAVLIDGRARKLDFINIKKFVKYFKKAADVAASISRKTGRNIYVSNWVIKNLFEPRDYFCNVVRGNRILVTPDGKISKCIRNMHGKESPFIVGDMNKNKIDLNYNKLSFFHNLSANKMQQCQGCFAKYICGGGCFNENYQENGDFLVPSKKKCLLAKTLVRELLIKMHKSLKTAH